jgi:hypothetical protein
MALIGTLTIGLGSGCGESSTPGVDGGVGTSRSFVMRTMDIPTSATEATSLGYDIDGDGTVDNTLGTILAAVQAAAPSLDLQDQINQSINDGIAVTLMRVTAQNFTSDSSVTLDGWTGESTTCCAARPCPKSEADTQCFGGDHTFKAAASSPRSTMTGKITTGKVAFGPGNTNILIPMGNNQVQVQLVAAKVEGMLSANGIVSGRLMGAISSTEVANKVVPAVANQLTREMNDPKTSASNRAALQAAFDTDNNGTITSDELKANAAVKALLAGDVDANKDGKKEELSAGVGFTAVKCKIQTQ